MSLRKDRIHQCGLSNIDFRSKGDIENLNFFEPWKTYTNHFGTMGNKNYVRSYSSKKEIFKPSIKINTQKDIVNDVPDPRYYTTTKFYEVNKIDVNTRNIFTNERVANLEETFKGKEPFTGDSMMISDLTKKRRKKGKKYLDMEERRKQQIKSQIIKDKSDKNKSAIQETQLVKINVKDTKGEGVDISKINEIRLAIRRRYGNRSNFRKIFKEWAQTSNNEITIYDAHSMINKLSIPINLNETKALIASSNNRGTLTLNLEEFMHLIFEDNIALNADLTKGNKDPLITKQAQLSLINKMYDNIKEMSKTEELNLLMNYLRARLSKFMKFINEEGGKKGFCNYITFKNSINKFQIEEKLKKEPILRALYDSHKNEEGLLDCQKLSETLISTTQPEYLSHQKDIFLSNRLENIRKKAEDLDNFIDSNKSGFYSNKEKIRNLRSQIEEKEILKKKEIEEEIKLSKEINNTIPSTRFINKVYKNNEECYKKLNEVEESFGTRIKYNKQLFPNTRFSANPKWRKTEEILQGDFSCPTFISERERFNSGKLPQIAYLEKKEKLNKQKARAEKIKFLRDRANSIDYWKNYLIEEKDKYTQFQKAKLGFEYENLVMIHNKIIE